MITIEELADRLCHAIDKGLPGTDVQWEMASSDRRIKGYPRQKGTDSGLSAVLILLYPVDGVIKTVLIQRPTYNGVHSGQIGFPGGKMEKTDKTLIDTSLREACEETGICRDNVKLIGTLTPLYISVSNTEVTPVVAWCESRPDFILQAEEVVSIIEVPIGHFTDPSFVHVKGMTIRGEDINVRYFDYNGKVIWGATAMIIYELVVILERSGLTSLVQN